MVTLVSVVVLVYLVVDFAKSDIPRLNRASISWQRSPSRFIDIYTDLEGLKDMVNDSTVFITIKSIAPRKNYDGDILLVHCDSIGYWNYAEFWNTCFCYHDKVGYSSLLPLAHGRHNQSTALRIGICPMWNQHLFYTVSKNIATTGDWHNILIITDDRQFLAWLDQDGYISQYASAVGSCKITATDVIYIINTTATSDYVNIILNCPESETVRIISQELSILDGSSYNILLYYNKTSDITSITRSLKTGDNTVFVVAEPYNNIPINSFILSVLDGLSTKQSLWTTDIYWCFMTCCNPQSLWKHGQISRPSDILHIDWAILPENFVQFHGMELVITYGKYKPFCYDNQDPSNPYLKGVDIDIIGILSEKLNFSYRYVKTIDGNWGSQNPNGSWNGMVGMVLRKEADLAICGISVSSARAEVIDYIFPHWEDPLTIVFKLNKRKTEYFIRPFSFYVWIIVGILPVIISIILMFIECVGDRIMSKQKLYVRKYKKKELPRKLLDSCFLAFGCLTAQGYELTGNRCSSRLVIASFWLTIIMLSAVYSGNLTASLAVSKATLPFTTLQGLAQNDDYILIVQNGTISMQIFQEGSTEVYRQLWNKIQRQGPESFVPDDVTGFEKVLYNHKHGFTGDKTYIMTEMAECDNCGDLVFLPEEFNKAGMGIVVKQKVPYKRKLDAIVMKLLEQGFSKLWTRKYQKQVQKATTMQNVIPPVGLQDVYLVFLYIFGAGFLCALIFLILEYVCKHKHSIQVLFQGHNSQVR